MSAQRRRAKAVARRESHTELDVRWAFKLDRTPIHAVEVSYCTCGRVAWLMPGATADEQRDFQQAEDDHSYFHDVDDWDAA